MPKIIVVLQGRLRSTRLPAKGFLPFFGQTIWERMCDIGKSVESASEVFFATGDLPENQLARDLVEPKGVIFHAGSEADVLGRFHHLARVSGATHLIRITCDNYLVQPEVVEGLLRRALEGEADYAFVEPLSHYAGEIIASRLLIEHYESGRFSELAREHVTWDFRKGAARRPLALPSDFMGLRHDESLTLDTIDDFVRMKNLERDHKSLRPVRCIDALRRAQDAS